MLDFNKRPSMGDRITTVVDAALEAERAATPPRDYLGASRLGHACERALQFEFVTAPKDEGQEPRMRRPRPGPRQITEAEEALLWLRWLEVDNARIVWLRTNRKPWKPICWGMGISRTAATRHWRFGIALITWRLNGRRPSSRRSKRFVIENANALSRKIVL